MRYAFILAEKAVFGVELLCRLLEVSVSGFYDWVAAADSRALRAKRREEMIRQLVTRLLEAKLYGRRVTEIAGRTRTTEPARVPALSSFRVVHHRRSSRCGGWNCSSLNAARRQSRSMSLRSRVAAASKHALASRFTLRGKP